MHFDRTITVPEGGLATGRENPLPTSLADRVDYLLIPEEVLQQRVSGLAQQIRAACADSSELILLVVLKGAFMFAADLSREIARLGGLEFRCEFVRTSTYGNTIKQPDEKVREVSMASLPADLAGKDVLLIEDLIDQGFTITALKQRVVAARARSVQVCALLTKRLEHPSPAVSRNRAALTIDFVGFDVPDRWVAGYGTDAGEHFRMLPYIVTVREQVYASSDEQ